MINFIILLSLLLVCIPLSYLYLLLLFSLRTPPELSEHPEVYYAVSIPAHNEAQVIVNTILSIKNTEYPPELVDVFVGADHCTDGTAEIARKTGALCYEREEGERGKGETLSWLFKRIFETGKEYGGIVVFDADTQVHPGFFKVMSACLASGVQVVQGNHVIRNPRAGWFPALTWVMFLIDNRCQNLGRANLGLSSKNMGDSICFRPEILKNLGWGQGLTEDYAFRQQLLLKGIRIQYEPKAIGYGNAAINWQEAKAQRARWLRGAYQASRITARKLFIEGVMRRDPALLDGALQAYLPSYSTMTLLTCVLTAVTWRLRDWLWVWLPYTWLTLFLLAFLYPILGLVYERAPLRAYWIILTGPIFILWRTWLSISSRFFHHDDRWVRTPRHVK